MTTPTSPNITEADRNLARAIHDQLAAQITNLRENGPHISLVETVALIASYRQQLVRETLERADLTVLEQRCERDTPWDLAILAASRAVKTLIECVK